MFQSNLKFFLKSTINIADTTSDTFIVSEDFELGAVIDTGGETVSIVLRNARQIERFEATITAGVATIVKRGLTQVATSTEDSNLKKQWTEGTTGYITALAFDLLDKGGDTMTGALKFSGVTNQGLVVNSLTTTQRLALTPTNGAIVYDSTLGENYQYIGGAWSAVSSGSVQPNASSTVAGKVEIATDAQITSGTDIGETGALLVLIPSQEKKSISLKSSGTIIEETDEFVYNDSGTDKRITKSVVREQMASSETLKGTIEIATSSEAITGTDTTRSMTPSTTKDSIKDSIGTVTTGLSFGTNYLAATSGFVAGYTNRNGGTVFVTAYVGETSPATTFLLKAGSDSYETFGSFCFPVKKGYYWRADVSISPDEGALTFTPNA